MNLSTINERLLWKETRQVLPLALSLLGITCVVILAYALYWNLSFASLLIFSQYAFAGPPILFAIGASSALVSSEKESRSLDWLLSLPVSHNYIVRHQLIVAFTVLIALWLINLSFILLGVVLEPAPSGTQERSVMLLLYMLNSLYLLACGFTTAWRSRHTMLALIAIVALAVLPYLAVYAIHYLCVAAFNLSPEKQNDPSLWLTAAVLLVSTAAMGRYAMRVANQIASGTRNRTPLPRVNSALRYLDPFTIATQNYFRGDSLTKTTPPTPTSALMWQFTNQNRTVVCTLTALFLACSYYSNCVDAGQRHRLFFSAHPRIFCNVVTYCSLSWIALLTFHGDGVRERVRFLAYHGVSPTRVWLTRQLIPILIWGFYVTVLTWQIPWSNSEWNVFVICCAAFYCVSQWIAQMIRPLAIAAPVAPLITVSLLVASVVLSHFIFNTMTPLSVFSVTLIPLFATWWTMPNWMDGRRTARYWLTHLSFACIALLIPWWPVASWYWTAPSGFSPEDRARIHREAATIVDTDRTSLATWPLEPVSNIVDANLKGNQVYPLEVDFSRQRQLRYEALAKATRADINIVVLNPRQYEILQWIMDADELRLEYLANTEDKESRASTLLAYRNYLKTLARLVTFLRHSDWLSVQESCDLLEIWLLSQIVDPTARRLTDDATYTEIVQNVSQTDLRWEARKRSLTRSLSHTLDTPVETQITDLDGVQILFQPKATTSILEFHAERRQFEHVMKVLLEYIDDARTGLGEFPRAELIELTGATPASYGVGSNGPYERIDDVSKFSLGTMRDRAFAAQWGAGWETTASDLARQLPSTSKENVQ